MRRESRMVRLIHFKPFSLHDLIRGPLSIAIVQIGTRRFSKLNIGTLLPLPCLSLSFWLFKVLYSSLQGRHVIVELDVSSSCKQFQHHEESR